MGNKIKQAGKLYMRGLPDGQWTAYVCPQRHAEKHNYIFLTEEGLYPVNLYYARIDMMGSKVVEMRVCHDQQELLETLDWCGKCRMRILRLWQHDLDQATDPKLFELYAECGKREYELMQEDIEAFLEANKENDCN